MDEKILDMFLNKRYSPYSIHLETGCSMRRITQTIATKRDREALSRDQAFKNAS